MSKTPLIGSLRSRWDFLTKVPKPMGQLSEGLKRHNLDLERPPWPCSDELEVEAMGWTKKKLGVLSPTTLSFKDLRPNISQGGRRNSLSKLLTLFENAFSDIACATRQGLGRKTCNSSTCLSRSPPLSLLRVNLSPFHP